MQYHKRVSNNYQRLLRFTKRYGRYRLGLYVAFALTGLSGLFQALDWLPLFCLVPLFLYIKRSVDLPARRVVFDFYVSGLLLHGFAYIFLLQIKPNNWAITLPTWIAVVASIVAYILIIAFCSLPLACVGWLISRIKTVSSKQIAVVLLIPFSELLRSYFIALQSYGPGNSISPNYNFGSLASIVSGTNFVYAGIIVGFFGLSALVLILNLGLVYIWTTKTRVVGIVLIGLVCLAILGGWLAGRAQGTSTMKVAAVHVNEEELLDTWKGWRELPDNLDLLVLPEYSDILKNSDREAIARKLKPSGLGITSTIYQANGRTYNQLQFFDNQGRVINTQNKTFTIPSGESMPYILKGVFYAIGQKELVKQFGISQQITPGDTPEYPFAYKDRQLGALICSGVIALNEYSRLSNEGADVLINAASLSFLTRTSLYHTHASNMARFHAVTNKKPFIQASRSGHTFIMNAQGQRLQSYSGAETTIITGTVSY